MPVLPEEILQTLAPRPGETFVDATVGLGGHAKLIAERLGSTGTFIGCDFDPASLAAARNRLAGCPARIELIHGNFAGLPANLARIGISRVDGLLADLGVSSPQLDDAARGFSFVRPGPIDMRMDPTRGKTAADVIAQTPEAELGRLLMEIGDEPLGPAIASEIKRCHAAGELADTAALAAAVRRIANPERVRSFSPRGRNLASVARVFQTLRILVNRELANLECLLRMLPSVLKPGGRTAIVAFHSGEDRLVKQAFKQYLQIGAFGQVDGPIRASESECAANPRARSAKLRWAVRGG
jgi:16S rRNA (cytosine1402-N4)-methyltransferase